MNDLLMAAVDNMSDLEPQEVADQLATLLVKTTMACVRGKEGFEPEQAIALATGYLALCPEADHVSGREAEQVYHDEYQRVWKHDMEATEDSENWNGEFDWTKAGFYPLGILKRVARACAAQDAVDTKAWYKFCKDHPERLNVGAS